MYKCIGFLYAEDYRMLMDKTNKDVNTWEDKLFMDQKTQHTRDINFSQVDTQI